MQGSVINFNLGEGKGLITGDDGQRYQFNASDWKEGDAPRRGDRVDYIATDGNASEIYALTAVYRQNASMAESTSELGWCKSNDEQVLSGVCAGLARHLNVSVLGMRLAMVLLTFFFLISLVLYIALWLILPSKSTKYLSY